MIMDFPEMSIRARELKVALTMVAFAALADGAFAESRSVVSPDGRTTVSIDAGEEMGWEIGRDGEDRLDARARRGGKC